MKEGKFRNGTITVTFTPVLGPKNRLRQIGYFCIGNNGETVVYMQKPNTIPYYPLYLEIRSHDIFRDFVGNEITLKGNLTINEKEGRIVSAHITPINLPLLNLLREKIIFLRGQVSMIGR